MRLIKTVLFGVFMSFLASCAMADDPIQIEHELLDPSVQLVDGCSGTIIKSEKQGKVYHNTILTAKHCVDDLVIGTEIGIYDPTFDGVILVKERYFYTRLANKHPTRDLALLTYQTSKEEPTAYMGDTETFNTLYIGQEAIAVGYPYSQSLTFSKGNLGPLERSFGFGISAGLTFQRSTTQAGPGASGCGLYVYDRNHYRYIGTLTGGLGTDENFVDFMTYFTPLNIIIDYLKDNNI